MSPPKLMSGSSLKMRHRRLRRMRLSRSLDGSSHQPRAISTDRLLRSGTSMPIDDETEDVALATRVRRLYDAYGQRKPMGAASADPRRPHFFLLRTFRGQNDLLVILNTKRCQYQCHFCRLPAKSSKVWIN